VTGGSVVQASCSCDRDLRGKMWKKITDGGDVERSKASQGQTVHQVTAGEEINDIY